MKNYLQLRLSGYEPDVFSAHYFLDTLFWEMIKEKKVSNQASNIIDIYFEHLTNSKLYEIDKIVLKILSELSQEKLLYIDGFQVVDVQLNDSYAVCQYMFKLEKEKMPQLFSFMDIRTQLYFKNFIIK